MAKTTKSLTNTEVSKAKPKSKEYNLADGDGLALRVKPQGSKLWIFNYSRPFTKKRANISFGNYPDVSLANAREKRTNARKLLAKDIDPKTHKEEITEGKKAELNNTLLKVATDWFEIKKKTIATNTAKDTWNSLNNHIFPKLGNHPVTALTPVIVIDAMKPIANKGSLFVIKRLCQRLNEIMTYSANVGLIDSNPLTGILKAFEAPRKQHYPTIKPEELPKLMADLSYSTLRLVTRLLIEWQLHTMVRSNEAAAAKWADIDVENACWRIPGDVMKMNKPHVVPLTPQTLAILERIKPVSADNDYIFPANRNLKGHANRESANMALKRIGYKNKLVAHGLRSLASTTLNEQGFDADVIESALAHVDKNEVRRAYNHAEYLERRRVMMAWWSEHIVQAKTGKVNFNKTFTNLKVINNG
jgi:integrase